jgi:hypothetical protein
VGLSLRASVSRLAGDPSRLPPLDPAHEAEAPGMLIAAFPVAMRPARCGAFADERRLSRRRLDARRSQQRASPGLKTTNSSGSPPAGE